MAEKGGRVGDGTVYECFHGGNFVTTNIVLEWKPFERAVSENTYVASTSFIATIDLAPTDGGTRLTCRATSCADRPVGGSSGHSLPEPASRDTSEPG